MARSSSDPIPVARSERLVLGLFTAAVFLSALLLFGVQPMFSRMVLPQLGGSPSVWSVAMVFFQSMLLAGYAYAHFLMGTQNRRLAVAVHLALLTGALITLPLSIADWGAPPASGTAFWLLGLFTVSIGLPFFALAANNPLLQTWFVRTGHREAHDPYFLYAASNIGSFLALLSYPLLLEPAFTLHTQGWLWSGGFALLVALIAACGTVMLRSGMDAVFGASAICRSETGLAADRPLGFPLHRAVGPARRRHRAYFNRADIGAPSVGDAAVALSSHLGSGLPAQAGAFARACLKPAALRGRRDRRIALPRPPRANGAKPDRAPACILHHCHGLSWRARAHAPGACISVVVLRLAVVRWHARRPLCRSAGAVHFLLDRGVPNSRCTGGALPPLDATATKRHLVLGCSARRRRFCRIRVFAGQRHRGNGAPARHGGALPRRAVSLVHARRAQVGGDRRAGADRRAYAAHRPDIDPEFFRRQRCLRHL